MQHVIWPWTRSTWPAAIEHIQVKISNISTLDSILAKSHANVNTRDTITALMRYHMSETYAPIAVSEREVLDEVIPYMQELIGCARTTFKAPVYILPTNTNCNVSLTHTQVATIIACLFFDLINDDYLSDGDEKIDNFTYLTLANIFVNEFAFHCILTYFLRASRARADGIIIVKRFALDALPDWRGCNRECSQVYIGEGALDESSACIHVIHAHELICNDMFGRSLSQEEIVMLIKPELLVVPLLCPRLADTDSIAVIGAEKFVNYSGMGSSVRATSHYKDPAACATLADSTKILKTAVVFMDATHNSNVLAQNTTYFDRDLNKAYCAFVAINTRATIAAGHWIYDFDGCNIQVRFIQQLLAASLARRPLSYHPVTREIEAQVCEFMNQIHKRQMRVGDLYALYKSTTATQTTARPSEFDFFESIIRADIS